MEEKVSAITLTGGNLAPFIPLLQSANLRTLVLVSSRKQAQKAEQLGASAVIPIKTKNLVVK
ncbi:hypothetical protein [Paenibacillus anseongense]|uniref:hypothetical protein n=1 Tax=Paenibacillus anseongense TaxID=2682845 RepID=UPI002DB7323B|nr:hypothetical protein [Paenibacillus anseongense]MEC0270189.1 hypothetical protein [Paenibacillus anseongense]